MSSAHVQELRGQYVRRLPTSTEIASRPPIVLTERDQQLLVAVHRHGLMTTDLVELAFFPPRNRTRSGSSSKAYERLRDLWLWGYLERVEPPVARVLGGRRPFLYALGQQAMSLVESRMGSWTLPVQPRRLDRLDHIFVEHDLQGRRAVGERQARGDPPSWLSLAVVWRARAQGQSHARARAAGQLLAAVPA